MTYLECRSPHPDDYGPIVRRCCLMPRHPGPHRWFGQASRRDGAVDEWEG